MGVSLAYRVPKPHHKLHRKLHKIHKAVDLSNLPAAIHFGHENSLKDLRDEILADSDAVDALMVVSI